MKKLVALLLVAIMAMSVVATACADALSICSADNTFGLSTDPALQQAVVDMLEEACNVELEAIIPNAIIIDDLAATDKGVSIGSTVTVLRLDNNTEMEFALVGSQEANHKAKPMRLSDESPFGKAVMGHHEGDTVTVEAPAMSFQLKILNITR